MDRDHDSDSDHQRSDEHTGAREDDALRREGDALWSDDGLDRDFPSTGALRRRLIASSAGDSEGRLRRDFGPIQGNRPRIMNYPKISQNFRRDSGLDRRYLTETAENKRLVLRFQAFKGSILN